MAKSKNTEAVLTHPLIDEGAAQRLLALRAEQHSNELEAIAATLDDDVLDAVAKAVYESDFAGPDAPASRTRQMSQYDADQLDQAYAVLDLFGTLGDTEDGETVSFTTHQIDSLATWGAEHANAQKNPLPDEWGTKKVKERMVELIQTGAADRVPLQFSPFALVDDEGKSRGYWAKRSGTSLSAADSAKAGSLARTHRWVPPTIHWSDAGCRQIVFITLPTRSKHYSLKCQVIAVELQPTMYVGDAPDEQGEIRPTMMGTRYLTTDMLDVGIINTYSFAAAQDAIAELRNALRVMRTHDQSEPDDEVPESVRLLDDEHAPYDPEQAAANSDHDQPDRVPQAAESFPL